MSSSQAIVELVERFDRNLPGYHIGRYNETQVRREFLDPLFEMLGWDIANKQGYSEAYKDVIHEDAIKFGGGTKAPDYGFRVGGTRKFFVEAKKPSIDVRNDPHPAYQLRRYAWSAKLPLSILTDFEEFAVYDCRVKPDKSDKSSTARVTYLTYKQYPEHWDEIAGVFSRDAILAGAFDKYAEVKGSKRGTAEVDKVFLSEIERWREALASIIALRNPTLSQRQLNFSVQATIDRIIFLRICEDRGIETYGAMQALIDGGQVYEHLLQRFHQADARYNSGLFHFEAEKGRAESSDTLTPSLTIDDKILNEILKNLYYPDSPYEFSVLPSGILGQVYEQFLGKVIRLTTEHRAVVEEKPEVRKAGGVFYTPTFIVDTIVRQTLGKLLASLTLRQVAGLAPRIGRKAAPVRVADIACGSGSFQLGAYQFLLDWYLAAYLADGREKWATGRNPRLYQTARGEWRLTITERKRILLDHIYGVDIDPQAVEVTKLSLLLKVLEGEDEQTINQQLALFPERALPDLGRNIKCGNSLIGPDFNDGQQLALLDDQAALRINVFDWQAEFPQVFADGGFDAIIGNPPYIRIQALKEWVPVEVEYYKRRYRAASKGNYDIYVVFVEKALELLNERGRLGYILPNKFLATDYGQPLRELIVERQALSALVDFGHEQVFDQATTYTCLLFLSGSANASFEFARVKPSSQTLAEQLDFRELPSSSLTGNPWLLTTEQQISIAGKLRAHAVELLSLPAMMSRGSSSGDDGVFILQRTTEPDKYLTSDGETVELEEEVLRTPLFATDFNRYRFTPKADKVIVFPYQREQAGSIQLLSELSLKSEYPNAYQYLSSRKKQLEQRKQYRVWYGFSAPRNLEVHDVAQLVVPLLADRGLYAELPSDRARYCLMASGGFSITVDGKSGLSPRFVLGLLNSRLLFGQLQSISNVFRGGWITCTKQYVGTLPIRPIDFTNPADVAGHDQMVALVERVLDLHKRVAAEQVPHVKTMLQRQIEATDQQIDQLVYKLYDLTDDEIKIVEESAAKS